MQRGDLYLVHKPTPADPRHQRPFVVVSRQLLIDSSFSTLICAPIYSRYHGIATQVPVGIDEGLKHESGVHCDELITLSKARLTHYLGCLRGEKRVALDRALAAALDILAEPRLLPH